MDLLNFDHDYRARMGWRTLAGIDEAGRGPWAGPVVAAAVILPPECTLPTLNDSKKLSPRQRSYLFDTITACAVSIGIGIIPSEMIDMINIRVATHRAMRQALEQLPVPADGVIIDGLPVEGLGRVHNALIKGDGISAAIAAASIIAKVTRDRMMDEYAVCYPNYGFNRHKGYGTAEHQQALKRFGPCPIHRMSFRPVAEWKQASKVAS